MKDFTQHRYNTFEDFERSMQELTARQLRGGIED